MKLKVKFTKINHDALAMLVLEQSERGFEEFVASSGMRVMSTGFPEIIDRGAGHIYLRGSDAGCDRRTSVVSFHNTGERDAFLARVLQALREMCSRRGVKEPDDDLVFDSEAI